MYARSHAGCLPVGAYIRTYPSSLHTASKGYDASGWKVTAEMRRPVACRRTTRSQVLVVGGQALVVGGDEEEGTGRGGAQMQTTPEEDPVATRAPPWGGAKPTAEMEPGAVGSTGRDAAGTHVESDAPAGAECRRRELSPTCEMWGLRARMWVRPE